MLREMRLTTRVNQTPGDSTGFWLVGYQPVSPRVYGVVDTLEIPVVLGQLWLAGERCSGPW
jgi:hypothetical protein